VKIAIVGSGLAGLTAAVNLVDEGHEVEIYESRSFWGGKVGSWEDKDGNHIEMGLHVFFYNYANLFKLMKKVGALDNLLPKDHTHLFINNGGNLKSLDFRFPLGAPFNGLKAFFTTEQLTWVDKFRNALALGTSPIVRGLLDYEGAMKIIRDLDRISFKEWFLNHGGSEKSLERMWDPIAYALAVFEANIMNIVSMHLAEISLQLIKPNAYAIGSHILSKLFSLPPWFKNHSLKLILSRSLIISLHLDSLLLL